MDYSGYLLPTLIFLLFCIVHSLTASVWFKKSVFDKAPSLNPFYRLIYNFISVLFLIAWFFALPADVALYQASGIFLVLMGLIQLTAIWFFLKSLFQQSGMIFLGIRQAMDKIRHSKEPGYLDEPVRGELITEGLFKYMRHPMYTFGMLVLISSPIMTANLLYTIIIFGLYFWIGSIFEEKNLIKRFGDDYRKYQEKVPRFIPRFKTSDK